MYDLAENRHLNTYLYILLEMSMHASHTVWWENQILHVHFKSTNHNNYRGDNLK